MADEVKKVGVEWVAKFESLKRLGREQERYINNMKKMNQVQKSVVGVARSVDQGFARQAQALTALGQGISQQTQAMQQQSQSAEQYLQVISHQLDYLYQINEVLQQNAGITNRAAEATKKQSNALNINTKAWYGNIRTLALYTIGAASVYRLIMKLRRALTETVKTVFEQTSEYQKMLKAQDNLKGSLIAFLGTDCLLYTSPSPRD